MKFLLYTVLAASLIIPGCTKNKKHTTVTETTITQDTTISVEPVNVPPMPQPRQEAAPQQTTKEPETFKDAVIKFFSPSPSTKKTDDKKDNSEESTQTPAEPEKEVKNAVPAEPEQVKPQLPTYPELKAEEDPKAIILKTDDGRLTSPFYFAKDASQEEIKNLKKPVWFGETLKYNVGWSFIVAGVAELNTRRIVNNNGTLAYELRADANSHSIIDSLFKVRDINISWLDIGLDKSLGYWQSVKEGKYARDEWVTFDYTTNTYNNHKQDRDGNIKTQQVAFVGDEILDMLSALYFVRLQELPQKGEVYFDIVNRKQQYPLKVIVHGKKKIKVKAGEFNCILVEPQFSGEGIFIAKGKGLKVWLTDDEYKMPVKMAVEVFIGSVTAELTEYSIDSNNSGQKTA